ncbi:MAG: dihydroorotate dehydrogenase electron transfer subunit [Clostridiales bacterium]|nr:dihydroorotate dehydrogenase electron transfer subunit [Clostridiales bacterium]
MNKGLFEIAKNENIAKNAWKMILRGDTSAVTKPGQFINIELDGFYLRRPISVCDLNGSEVTIIYKTVGKGTEYMAELAPGVKLDVLSGLGNGFDTGCCGHVPLLIGGGAGVAPMYMLARDIIAAGKKPSVIIGFGSADEVFLEKEFEALGVNVFVTTVDGSRGIKGFVTDALDSLPEAPDYHYVCGPEAMMKAVYSAVKCAGQYSFEERMGCGFGACMGCSCKTKYGNKRICKDGPVLVKEEIIW